MAGRVAPAVVSDSIILYVDSANIESKNANDTNWNDLGRNQYNLITSNSTFNEKYIPTMTFAGLSYSYAKTTAIFTLPYQVTYNMWIRGAAKTRQQIIFSDAGQDFVTGHVIFTWGSANGFAFGYAKGDSVAYGSINYANFFAPFQNEWVNLTYVVDYTAVEPICLYRNGILFATSSFYTANNYSPTMSVIPVPPPYSNPFTKSFFIGNYNAGHGSSFQGDISIVQIYGRLLSADEVLRNYNAMLPRHSWFPGISTNGLQLYLDPADKRSYPGTGTVLTDLSPNGYTFSMINATYNSLNKGNILYNGTSSSVASAKTFALYNQTSFNFWERSDILPSPSLQMFIGDAGQTTDATGTYSLGYVSMYRQNRDLIYQSAYGGPVWQTMQSSNFFLGYTASDWVNVTVTADYDNKITAFYKNGQLNATFSMTGTPIVPRNLNKYIGSWYTNAHFLKGNIGVFTIYNRILTADEIYNDYQALRGRYSAKEK